MVPERGGGRHTLLLNLTIESSTQFSRVSPEPLNTERPKGADPINQPEEFDVVGTTKGGCVFHNLAKLPFEAIETNSMRTPQLHSARCSRSTNPTSVVALDVTPELLGRHEVEPFDEPRATLPP